MIVVNEKSQPRYPLRVHVSFQLLDDSSPGTEFTSETVNISAEGLFLRLSQRINAGSLLALRLRLPTESSESPFHEIQCIGRVVSERRFPDGTFGYDVEIVSVSPRFK
jgi:hypothetical protein